MFEGILKGIRQGRTSGGKSQDNRAAGEPTRPLGVAAANKPPAASSRFRLVRYFTLASVGIFTLVALAMVFHEAEQTRYLVKVQDNQAKFFGQVQSGFAKQQEEAAYRHLLAAYDSGHVNLTQLFVNALWERDFAPFFAKAHAVPVEHCRALPDPKDKDGRTVLSPEKKACFAEVGKKIQTLAEFKGVDAKVFDATRKSTVHKIKLYDLRGITLYSSEHAQMGDDKATNGGFKSAAAGKVANDLSHRDKFNAFEGVVENRDLISSYLPVYAPQSDKIIGVLEVYSDVTPMLEQIKKTSAQIKKTAADNMAKVQQGVADSEKEAEQEAVFGIAAIFGLLALLFAALFLIVRRAAGIISHQEEQRDHHHQQQLVQSEKMAALGQMVAGVAHQLNTPLAFSQSNVSLVMEQLENMQTAVRIASKFSEIVKRTPGETVVINLAGMRQRVEQVDASSDDIRMMREMLKDVLDGIGQMSELVVHMRDFTRLDRNKVAEYDLNRGLRSVVYIAKSVIPSRINVVEQYGDVPEIMCHASLLNQVFLNLVNNAAHAIADSGTITVTSELEGEFIKVSVSDTGSGVAPDVLPHIFETYYTTKSAGEGTGLGLTIALDVVRNHGGDIKVETELGKGSTFSVFLPVSAKPSLALAA